MLKGTVNFPHGRLETASTSLCPWSISFSFDWSKHLLRKRHKWHTKWKRTVWPQSSNSTHTALGSTLFILPLRLRRLKVTLPLPLILFDFFCDQYLSWCFTWISSKSALSPQTCSLYVPQNFTLVNVIVSRLASLQTLIIASQYDLYVAKSEHKCDCTFVKVIYIAFEFVYLLASLNASSLNCGFFLILDLCYSNGSGDVRYTVLGSDGNMETYNQPHSRLIRFSGATQGNLF